MIEQLAVSVSQDRPLFWNRWHGQIWAAMEEDLHISWAHGWVAGFRWWILLVCPKTFWDDMQIEFQGWQCLAFFCQVAGVSSSTVDFRWFEYFAAMEVWSALLGERIAVLEADEFEGKSVKAVKQFLAAQVGVSRFRQRHQKTAVTFVMMRFSTWRPWKSICCCWSSGHQMLNTTKRW